MSGCWHLSNSKTDSQLSLGRVAHGDCLHISEWAYTNVTMNSTDWIWLIFLRRHEVGRDTLGGLGGTEERNGDRDDRINCRTLWTFQGAI